MSREEDSERAGPVSVAEARDAVARFNDSHFNNPGEHARYTIPADPKRDDDIRLNAYITQSEQRIATLEAALRPFVEAGDRRTASGDCVVHFQMADLNAARSALGLPRWQP